MNFSNIENLTEVEVDLFAKRAMNDFDFMNELYNIGKSSTETYLSELDTAISESDIIHFRNIAHTLKSNVDLLGMVNIGKLLRVWIDEAHNGTIPINNDLLIVQNSINECLEVLNEFINKTKLY
jgi:hypothetical protein